VEDGGAEDFFSISAFQHLLYWIVTLGKVCSNRKGIFTEYHTFEIEVVARNYMNCL
jgi:hypothetical protein